MPLKIKSPREKNTDRYLDSDSRNLPVSVVRRYEVMMQFEFTNKRIFKLI